MVFGSPKQRATTGGATREEATRRFADGFRELAGHAESRNVTMLVEALPAGQCDVVQTLAEAAAIVREIGSPAVRTMFDTHNAVDETEPHVVLIERYFPLIRHVHVNEMDGRYPGTGDYDFGALLEALERLNYSGWVSLEAMDFRPDPVTIARESLRYLKGLESTS
jgi:sugar phosphate isomerase/epimerase